LLADLPEGVNVAAPPTALLLALRQLALNGFAAVAGREDRWLQIAVETVLDEVAVKVTDSGRGVPEDERERIMEPFYRGAEASRMAFDADGAAGDSAPLGLGLAIVRRTAERFGGRVELSSEPGPTQFILWLPRAEV
jgi:signal transduction histidine kinase